MVDLFLASFALLLCGLAAAATSVATTVLTTRAPGMRMGRVPFFAWSALIASIGLLLMLPVLFGVLVYLYLDHRNARAVFGGNVGVGSWIAFALTQPATYLFALPAVGITAELTGQTLERIAQDSLRDRWYTAEQAVEYGFVDRIVHGSEELLGGSAHSVTGLRVPA